MRLTAKTRAAVALAAACVALALLGGCSSSCKKACRKIADCLGISLDGGAAAGWRCPVDEASCSGQVRCVANCFDDAACDAITGQDPAGAATLSACQAKCAEQQQGDQGVVTGDGSGPGECEPPLARCGSGCVDLQTSHGSCGSCGLGCSATEQCIAGACTAQSGNCIADGCAAGYYCNLADGRCLPGCAVEADCAGNACNVTTHTCCKAGQTPCSSACVDLDRDPDHCGGCEAACPTTRGGRAVCNAGECGVACDGGTLCDGQCVDTLADEQHCGVCGKVCYPPSGGTASCVNGSCQSTCPAGWQDCDGYCVDVQTDEYNCGVCYEQCTADYGATPLCDKGQCTVSCTNNLTPCGTKCVDTKTDIANCGSCGNQCTQRAPKCTDGKCGCQYNCGDYTGTVCCFSNECCPNGYCTTYGCLSP